MPSNAAALGEPTLAPPPRRPPEQPRQPTYRFTFKPSLVFPPRASDTGSGGGGHANTTVVHSIAVPPQSVCELNHRDMGERPPCMTRALALLVAHTGANRLTPPGGQYVRSVGGPTFPLHRRHA